MRDITIVSDLHLGGADPSGPGRGFQMMTQSALLADFIRSLAASPPPHELVIAGDFVDYLAHGVAPVGQQPETWDPLIAEPSVARAMFEQIANRTRFRVVFDALADFVMRGHRLVVLLGNHDVELSYPEVRRALERRLGVEQGFGLHFVYDGEAYVVGDALIEHGNRYDPFNTVDHDRLRQARSLQSRGQQDLRKDVFEANAGSRLVASVMNPLKAQYAFIDLLKPEDAAVLPLLLTLDPGCLDRLTSAVRALAPAVGRGSDEQGVPFRLANASAGSIDDPVSEALSIIGDEDTQLENASALDLAGSLASLFGARRAEGIERRLPALARAFRVLAEDRSFELGHDTGRYFAAASALAREGGFRFIVFGHTHHAKDVALDGGARYLNSGTWADLMRVPDVIVNGTGDAQRAGLLKFVADVAENRISEYIWFRPTYVRLHLAEGRVLEAGVHEVR